MSRTQRWITALLLASLTVLGGGLIAGADSGSESEFVSKINSSRAANGLPPLTVDGNLRSYARQHTAEMIESGTIYHSSSGELAAAGGTGWDVMGENVGKGGTPTSLHKAFMDSPSHRANILGDFNFVGVGTGTSEDGYLYVTVIFMKKTVTTTTTTAPTTTTTVAEVPVKATTTTTVAQSPAKATTTTTTTTAPTTTTTTLDVPPDKPVTPGQVCVESNRFWNLCHD